MTLLARYNPATFDLTGMSEIQFDALRTGLVLVIQKQNDADPHSDNYERIRLGQIAAKELLDWTNQTLRSRHGDTDED
jgi:hypothetical protein